MGFLLIFTITRLKKREMRPFLWAGVTGWVLGVSLAAQLPYSSSFHVRFWGINIQIATVHLSKLMVKTYKKEGSNQVRFFKSSIKILNWVMKWFLTRPCMELFELPVAKDEFFTGDFSSLFWVMKIQREKFIIVLVFSSSISPAGDFTCYYCYSIEIKEEN